MTKSPANPLSATLRRLRKEAGLSGTEAAHRAGLSQSKISRVETGAFMPTEDQVRALCRVYDAPADVRRELIQLIRDLRAETTSARVVLQRGGWSMQRRIGQFEAASEHVRSFSPTVIIGLLQSRAYIRELFGDSLPEDERDATVAARLDRQRLLNSDRRFDFILTEGALRWNMGGPAVMIEQLEHLAELSHHDNVRIGVIPWTTPARVPPSSSFTIYDSRAVIVGTQTATAIITDERDVADYEAHWHELEPLVSHGEDARAVITRITADYRSIDRKSVV